MYADIQLYLRPPCDMSNVEQVMKVKDIRFHFTEVTLQPPHCPLISNGHRRPQGYGGHTPYQWQGRVEVAWLKMTAQIHEESGSEHPPTTPGLAFVLQTLAFNHTKCWSGNACCSETPFRGNICCRVQRAEAVSCSKEVGIKKEMKKKLGGGWAVVGENRAGATKQLD